jgi:protein SCO1/2
MNRRAFLCTGAVATGTVLAGCLGDDSNTVLDGPDIERADPEDLAYPAHGEELPDVTFPAPLHDQEISTREFVGERETILTFIFTRCPGPCPALTTILANVQRQAGENGYADEVALMPTTFDPERDDPQRLREFCDRNGADPTAENWWVLRPQSPQAAQEKINDTFYVGFEEVSRGNAGHDRNIERGETLNPGEGETTFSHANLIILANRDGYVERAYQRITSPGELLGDLETVRNAY